METNVAMSPLAIWHSMGFMGQMVLVFLLLMSVYSITIMVERHRFLRRARRQTIGFIDHAREMLFKNDIDAAFASAKHHPHSHVARIYVAAIQDFRAAPRDPAPNTATLQHAVEREALLVTQDFKRGLSGLASIGATAPFVGLFGTVIGIMNAFFGMAKTGQGGIGAVAGGIAEALVNTAAGLFVALPAVWAFNHFLGRIERLNVEMAHTGSELSDFLGRQQRSAA